MLSGGSFYAADLPFYGPELDNELQDWQFVHMGYEAYLYDK